ncbi:MAG: sigma-54 dependent transcriptional regulator [Kiritimatiellia bacterium]|jgi:DNA-binding NtrC family response regulator|nr:sigma-54 dependent transcriptional regulator [Kiritimatiellia bacterium]MDP6630458.1 sigma-54 dependent transcriptional regulator [Kiritimatiellia bacterium]MDP6809915.1 sigma-54 dependent transcriptional regulator [Kiritimatiellia bacterium]MDP7024307.1 sigma-54 dependent transcriptional regulator [Kiritimatiellia bacterium]
MKQHILVVDDELGPRESLKAVFSRDYDISLAESASEGMAVLEREHVDLVLLDVMMPEEDGLTFLRRLQTSHPDLPVVMISAASSVRPVVEAMRVGATDFVSKPFDVEEIKHIVRRALETSVLQRRVVTLEDDVAREFPVTGIVGQSPAFTAALDDVRKAAATDSTVLISGESGTGKELAARMLHSLSNRSTEPFVAVHCGALTETLMESELFGHEKGAFTGADKLKHGRFDIAGSGTLFFDEVSEMTLATQVKLLRVLQEREFTRVGGTQVIKTNARIVGASNRALRKEVASGDFRDDLYYRLSVVPVTLPPLRERGGDISLLVHHFLAALRPTLNVEAEAFAPETLALLNAYTWPGNIRELRNVVERMLVLHGSSRLIEPAFLPEEFHEGSSIVPVPPADSDEPLQDRVSAYEKQMIEKALQDTHWVQTRAAEQLGTTRRILRYRMEKLNIPAQAPST